MSLEVSIIWLERFLFISQRLLPAQSGFAFGKELSNFFILRILFTGAPVDGGADDVLPSTGPKDFSGCPEGLDNCPNLLDYIEAIPAFPRSWAPIVISAPVGGMRRLPGPVAC